MCEGVGCVAVEREFPVDVRLPMVFEWSRFDVGSEN